MSDIPDNSKSRNILKNPIHYSKILPENKINKIDNIFKSTSDGIRKNNSSINILNRNILSINNSNFDHLKKVKIQSTLSQLDKNENNYLNPISSYSFKNEEIKENQKKNVINSLQWLNIIKNKLFSVDINSKIQKGKNISRKIFYDQKKKIIISPNKILNISYNNNKSDDEDKVISSYQYKDKKLINNNGIDYKFNSAGSMDNIFNCQRFKIDSEQLNNKKMNIRDYFNNKKENIDYWKKIRLKKNKSLDKSFDEDLNVVSPEKLKSIFFNNAAIYHKNWWEIDQ